MLINIHIRNYKMEKIGFVFGLSGLSFALIAWEKIAKLRKEFEDLKKNIEDSGVLKDRTKPGDK